MRVSDFQAGKTEESKPEVPQAIIDMKKKEEEKKAKKGLNSDKDWSGDGFVKEAESMVANWELTSW